MTRRKLPTLEEVTEEYFEERPEEIEPFITEAFAEYGKDGDSAALLWSLRIVVRVKGLSEVAREIGMTRQGLQKALSQKGNPRLDNINAIMQAMGFRLMVEKMDPQLV